MTNYQPPRIATNASFFTVRLHNPASRMLVDDVDILRQAIRICRKTLPFEITAAVILPARLHMIWSLPAKDFNHSARWRMIKSTFSRHCPPPDPATLSPAMRTRREKGIWQRGFWQHDIRDQSDYDLHEHLIIHAPVTEGLVKRPRDWALSSLHRRKPRLIFQKPQPTAHPRATTEALL